MGTQINSCLQVILDEIDREGQRKRISLPPESCKGDPSKKHKTDSKQTGGKVKVQDIKPHSRLHPFCQDCKKQSGHEFHRNVKSTDGRSVICPKALKSQSYMERFNRFAATPKGQRAVLPVE